MRWQEMFKVNNDDTTTASIDFIVMTRYKIKEMMV